MASAHKDNLFSQTALAAAGPTNGAALSLSPRSKDFFFIIKAANVDPATTVSAKIQHSPDNVTWFDVVSFTNIVGAAGSECKTITGSLLPWTRAQVTLAGVTKLADVTIDQFCNPQGY